MINTGKCTEMLRRFYWVKLSVTLQLNIVIAKQVVGVIPLPRIEQIETYFFLQTDAQGVRNRSFRTWGQSVT